MLEHGKCDGFAWLATGPPGKWRTGFVCADLINLESNTSYLVGRSRERGSARPRISLGCADLINLERANWIRKSVGASRIECNASNWCRCAPIAPKRGRLPPFLKGPCAAE